MIDVDSSVDISGNVRALSLVFEQVSAPPDLQPKLTALLEKASEIAAHSTKEGITYTK